MVFLLCWASFSLRHVEDSASEDTDRFNIARFVRTSQRATDGEKKVA
jgi:hypothetical protein